MSTAIRILQGNFGRVALLDMDKPLITHAHHHCHILFKFGGADAFFTVRDRLQPLTDKTVVLINAWESHAYTHHLNDAPPTVILALYIECDWLAGIHRRLTVSSHPQFFPQACVELAPRTRRLAESLAWEMLDAGGIPQERLEQELFDLVIAVVDPYSEWRNAQRLTRPAWASPRDPRIRRAIELLGTRVGDGVDMDELAESSGLSRSHFFALFRRCTHVTPGVYANVLRMEAAIDGLTRSGDSIAALSSRLGFSAQGHFTRFFRQHLGITPSDYRGKVDVFRHERDPLII